MGVTPDGTIVYVSQIFGGSISDNELTLCCGLPWALEEGDCLVADKGFRTQLQFAGWKVSLVTPAHSRSVPGYKQDGFTAEQVLQTRGIANLRIHVERSC